MVYPYSHGLPPKHGKTPAGAHLYNLNANMTMAPAGSAVLSLQCGSSTSSSSSQPPRSVEVASGGGFRISDSQADSAAASSSSSTIGGIPNGVIRLAPPGYNPLDNIRPKPMSSGINDVSLNPHCPSNNIRLAVPEHPVRVLPKDSRPATAAQPSAFVPKGVSRPWGILLNGFANPSTRPSQMRPLDPSWDPKKARRVMANRLSAQKSRLKKLTYVHELHHTAEQLQLEVDELGQMVRREERYHDSVTIENITMKLRLASLANQKLLKQVQFAALRDERDRLAKIFTLQHQQTAPPAKYEMPEQPQGQQLPLLEQSQPAEVGWNGWPEQLEQRNRDDDQGLLDILEPLDPPNIFNLDADNLDPSNKTPSPNNNTMNNREMTGDLDNSIGEIRSNVDPHMTNNVNGINNDVNTVVDASQEVNMNRINNNGADASQELLDAVIRRYT